MFRSFFRKIPTGVWPPCFASFSNKGEGYFEGTPLIFFKHLTSFCVKSRAMTFRVKVSFDSLLQCNCHKTQPNGRAGLSDPKYIFHPKPGVFRDCPSINELRFQKHQFIRICWAAAPSCSAVTRVFSRERESGFPQILGGWKSHLNKRPGGVLKHFLGGYWQHCPPEPPPETTKPRSPRPLPSTAEMVDTACFPKTTSCPSWVNSVLVLVEWRAR